jgi:hypothetical protein
MRSVFGGRYQFLFTSLILLFILKPFLPGVMAGFSILDIFIWTILLSTVYAVKEEKGLFAVTICIFIVSLVLTVATYQLRMPVLAVLTTVSYVLFFGITGIMILFDVVKDEEVTLDKIFGAFCVFLFIGLVWAMIYALLENFQPGSFSNLPFGREVLEGEFSLRDILSVFIYYSFITLTTLGYGDITPVTGAARSFASLEAIVGQMYLTVLVARLVGLHIGYSVRKDLKNG